MADSRPTVGQESAAGYSGSCSSFSPISEVFADVESTELETVEMDEDQVEFDFIDQEWASLRDNSELCNLLCESDLMSLDVEMEECDESGNQQRSVTSLIGSLMPNM